MPTQSAETTAPQSGTAHLSGRAIICKHSERPLGAVLPDSQNSPYSGRAIRRPGGPTWSIDRPLRRLTCRHAAPGRLPTPAKTHAIRRKVAVLLSGLDTRPEFTWAGCFGIVPGTLPHGPASRTQLA